MITYYKSRAIKQLLAIATLAATLGLVGCNEGNTPQLPGLTDQNATLIAFDETGEMTDFVHVRPDAHIERVEFFAPDNGDPIAVVAVGPALHPDFPENQTVTSQKAEGFQGKVTAEIKDGVVQHLAGNGMSFDSPLKLAHLETIRDLLATGQHQPSEAVRITQVDPAIRELITDNGGNRIPPDLTPSQSTFLDTVIQAVKAKDLETLKKFSHRDPGDRSSYDSTANYWKTILEKDLHHYRFMRFNPEHPDNHSKLELHDGRTIRHSLKPEWLLTIYHTPEDAYMTYSADLIVGDDNGQLKFPASYADPSSN